jgi:UDP-glucose 4-epimerase
MADDSRRPTDVMVIGGAGFIGSHFVDSLIADRAVVEVVDDLSSGSLANLADARASAPRAGGELHIHTLDATSADLATLITLRRPRHIVHLALLVPGASSVTDHGRSFSSMLTLLDAARAASVEKVVVLLPATVLYGTPSARQLPVKKTMASSTRRWRRRPSTGRVSFPNAVPSPGCSTRRPTVSPLA